jgi:DNA-binding helix-hairpin-helix protein with protein kinase domain
MSASTSKSPPPSEPLWAVGSGQALRLGTELGRGGEGSVVALADRPGQVVKLYHETPSARKVAKLTALVAASGPAVQKVAAWPQELVRNAAGEIVGFLMPRLAERRDIHQLYSPRSRAAAFPTADFRFIVHVAANIARAFAVLHAQGHIVGDVNHGSIVVNPDGTVQLIDCDSFQVRDGAEVFTCDVGVPLFTAPELHGKAFRELVRTPNHDQFGLAVVLFHLLCVGRHPFAGRFLGSGEMPIERAIAEFRFAYGPEAATRQMAPPPGTLPLEALGSEIAGLFGAAFAAKAVYDARPKAADWVSAALSRSRAP